MVHRPPPRHKLWGAEPTKVCTSQRDAGSSLITPTSSHSLFHIREGHLHKVSRPGDFSGSVAASPGRTPLISPLAEPGRPSFPIGLLFISYDPPHNRVRCLVLWPKVTSLCLERGGSETKYLHDYDGTQEVTTDGPTSTSTLPHPIRRNRE